MFNKARMGERERERDRRLSVLGNERWCLCQVEPERYELQAQPARFTAWGESSRLSADKDLTSVTPFGRVSERGLERWPFSCVPSAATSPSLETDTRRLARCTATVRFTFRV